LHRAQTLFQFDESRQIPSRFVGH